MGDFDGGTLLLLPARPPYCICTHTVTGRHTHRDRQTDRQTDRDKHMYTHTNGGGFSYNPFTSDSPSSVRSTAAGRNGLMSEKRSSWALLSMLRPITPTPA
jgi:hypothetical protein